MVREKLIEIGKIRNRAFSHIGGYVPDIYTASDAAYYLSQMRDPKYLLGTSEIDPHLGSDRAKIYSVAPSVMRKLREIVDQSGHLQGLPFMMGTYNLNSQEMRMNDLCLSDPWWAYLMATGGIEGFSVPFLRGLYYVGRRSWWRHESIHARHHLQMAYFLGARDKPSSPAANLEAAGLTIHESGMGELLTRWQTLKEARGNLEKGVSAFSMLLYLEYAPFTGMRNIFIDTKEQTLDLLKDGKVRIPAKLAVVLGIALGPFFLNKEIHFAESLGENAAQLIPLASETIQKAFWRMNSYTAVAVIGAMFSSKNKGALAKGVTLNRHLPTSEYKFPYVYNPASSMFRSIRFIHYLHNVWDQIPNFRRIKSTKGIDPVEREIGERVSELDRKQYQFTMEVVEEALRPVKKAKRSEFPQEVYLKGMFIPALYLRSRELFQE